MRIPLLLLVVGLLCSNGVAQDAKKSADNQPATKGEKSSPNKPTQEQLERQFAEKMSEVTLVGHFTDNTRQDNRQPREEKYTLGKVAKLQGDYWLIPARIQYGEHDLTVPLSLRVVWAGDTPVITLDKMLVPGFGTFTCRVMVFGDQYAGTWDGGNHGGHLYGRLVRAAKDEGEAKGAGPAATRKNDAGPSASDRKK